MDEAIAKYNKTIDEMHCFDPRGCQMCAEDKIALDAAVCDCMLAMLQEALDPNLSLHMVRQRRLRLKSEIKRRFGLPEGSEKEAPL
jgi:hypothetical protein